MLVNFKRETASRFISCDRSLNHPQNVENKENEKIGLGGDKNRGKAVV